MFALSRYYAERLAEGADQFATDVSANPNDTEEAIWHALCLARLRDGGLKAVRAEEMLRVGRDQRPVMRAVLELFERGAPAAAAEQTLERYAADGSEHDAFYANLYLGLYREALGDAVGARAFVTAAAGTPYAARSGDYMADLARVHLQRRGWK